MTAITQGRSGDRRVRVAEAPDGELLTVTMVSSSSWHPAVIGVGGPIRWRGEPWRTRLQAWRCAEGK